jgi:hypothetical protein
VLIATRIPEFLIMKLRQRALGTTLQLVFEYAVTLYLGTRLPPDIAVGPFLREERPDRYVAASSGPPRQLAARIPKSLLRWVRVYAAEAGITERELVLRAILWYLSRPAAAPTRNQVERDPQGILYVGTPLLALKFQGYTFEELGVLAESLLDKQTTKLIEATHERSLRAKDSSNRPPIRGAGGIRPAGSDQQRQR